MISRGSAIYRLNGKRNHYPITDRTTVIKFSLEKKWEKKKSLVSIFIPMYSGYRKKKVYLILKMVKYLTEIKLWIRE